jgi:hypothetical protein
MEAGLPDEDSPESREGRLLHDYAAHPEYERAMLKPAQQDLLKLSDDLLKQAIDRVELAEGLTGKPCETYTEQHLVGTKTTLEGTPDLLRYYPESETVLLADRKFGYNLVERAELNLQLRVYAVLACDFLGTAIEPSKVFVTILQPRAPFEERITIAQYLPEDIEDARAQILSILAATLQGDAPLNAGEEQCRHCKAKLVCPAFRDAMAIALIQPDKAMSVAARQAYLEKRLAECTDEQLEKVIEAERLAKMIHEPLYEEARKRIKNGALTNYELSKETKVREVTNVRRALALLSLAGFAKDDVYDCVTKFSLKELEDKVRKLHPTWPWKQIREFVDQKLSSVIEFQTRKERVIRK